MVGIVGYGAYIPKYRIKSEEIARIWGKDARAIKEGLLIEEKSVPGLDEDSVTIGTQAAQNALHMAAINPVRIGAVYTGTESKAYAVKPNATLIGEALGLGHRYMAADLEFACKAGTAGMQMVIGLVESNMIDYGLAVGTDTAQGRPGDALEYSASAGGAAYIIGRKRSQMLARLEATCSSSSDTPDFWRRRKQEFPVHRERFSGKPSYQAQIAQSVGMLMSQLQLKPKDFQYAAFHTPNGKFPLQIAGKLGFSREQVNPGYVVPRIGNTYSGASIISLAAVLDIAKPGDRILLASYGSGAGSDAFSFVVMGGIRKKRGQTPRVKDFIEDKMYLDYGQYIRHIGLLD